VPTSAAESREDRVIELVVGDLVESGYAAELVDRPHRNRSRPDLLTVDAELSVGDERWALDVMTLRWRPGLEGAVEKLEARLERDFRSQLDAVNTTLVVTGHVSFDESVIRPLVELARLAVESGQDQVRRDESASLWPRSSELGAVEVQPWLGTTADVRQEVIASSGETLGRKLRKQLARARELGYRTALSVDQHGSQDLRFGANFLPLPGTIIRAVEEVEEREKLSLDVLVLVRDDDSVHWVRR